MYLELHKLWSVHFDDAEHIRDVFLVLDMRLGWLIERGLLCGVMVFESEGTKLGTEEMRDMGRDRDGRIVVFAYERVYVWEQSPVMSCCDSNKLPESIWSRNIIDHFVGKEVALLSVVPHSHFDDTFCVHSESHKVRDL